MNGAHAIADLANVAWLSAASEPFAPMTASQERGASADLLPLACNAVRSAIDEARTPDVGTTSLRSGGSHDEGTQTLSPNPAPALVARLAAATHTSASRTRFDLRQQWEGTVVELSGDGFTVNLRDLTNPAGPEESAELFLEDVSEGDRAAVEPGAIFYWSVGYEDTPRGRERKSIIRFRRLPGWSRRELDAMRARAADLSSYFIGADSLSAAR